MVELQLVWEDHGVRSVPAICVYAYEGVISLVNHISPLKRPKLFKITRQCVRGESVQVNPVAGLFINTLMEQCDSLFVSVLVDQRNCLFYEYLSATWRQLKMVHCITLYSR